MRRRLWQLGAVFLGVSLVAGCAPQKPPEVEVVWTRADGSEPTREELDQAAAECREATRKSGGSGTGRFGYVEWAANMLECMKAKGYTRLEKPPETAVSEGDSE